MELRPLVMVSAALAAGVTLPAVLGFALAGHLDVARGLLLGLMVGLLNHLLLARKVGRMIDGREPWQNLKRAMRVNMLLRFGLIVGIGALAAHTPGINVTAVATGVAVYLVVSVVYSVWMVLGPWKKEGESPAYG